MPTIHDFFKNEGVGSGSHRLKIDENGQLRLYGNATVWDDITGSLIGRTLSSTSGQVDYDWDENAVKFQPNGSISNSADRIAWNQQYFHKAIVNGTLKLHMHWWQTDSYADMPVQMTVRYRIQSNGAGKTTAWTTLVIEANATNNVFDGESWNYATNGHLNQITKLASIDMTNKGISATVNFQVARTDSETGDILVTFIDEHMEIDSLGSNTEYSKDG